MPLPRLGYDLRQRLDTPCRRFQAALNASPTFRHLLISQIVGVIPEKVIRVRCWGDVHVYLWNVRAAASMRSSVDL